MTNSEDPTRMSAVGLPAPESEQEVDGPVYSAEEDDEVARAEVAKERSELRDFVKELSMDEIKSGGWFTKLLSHAMSSYTTKVDWAYFQEKYKGVPADGIVDQRIKMASRYAAIEGGLSASAYTGTIAATIGSGGGASPATVPAAIGPSWLTSPTSLSSSFGSLTTSRSSIEFHWTWMTQTTSGS